MFAEKYNNGDSHRQQQNACQDGEFASKSHLVFDRTCRAKEGLMISLGEGGLAAGQYNRLTSKTLFGCSCSLRGGAQSS